MRNTNSIIDFTDTRSLTPGHIRVLPPGLYLALATYKFGTRRLPVVPLFQFRHYIAVLVCDKAHPYVKLLSCGVGSGSTPLLHGGVLRRIPADDLLLNDGLRRTAARACDFLASTEFKEMLPLLPSDTQDARDTMYAIVYSVYNAFERREDQSCG